METINVNVLLRVFFIKYAQSTSCGTGFTIEKNGVQYLVTAKHVLEQMIAEKRTQIQVMKGNSWLTTDIDAILPAISGVDIVVLKLKSPLSPMFPILTNLDGVTLGQDTYFLGFPYGLQMTATRDGEPSFPIPFIKKGIISAITNLENKPTTIYIDGHNNKGFSGGPVVVWNERAKLFSLCGVVSAYLLNYNEPVFNSNNQPAELYYRENSGIVICHPIKYALDAISSIPEQ